MTISETIMHSSIFDETKKGELLFHYTSLKHAIDILDTQSLLFSKICKMNDMDESWRPIRSIHWEDDTIDLCEKELSSYVQISLTCEDNPETKAPNRGFQTQAAWLPLAL